MNTLSSLLDLVRWAVSVPLLLIFVAFALNNFRFFLKNFRVGFNAGPAPVTIVGGLAGCLGLLLIPQMELGDRLVWLWVPLLLDWGSLPFYLTMLVIGIWQRLSGRAWRHYWEPERAKLDT